MVWGFPSSYIETWFEHFPPNTIMPCNSHPIHNWWLTQFSKVFNIYQVDHMLLFKFSILWKRGFEFFSVFCVSDIFFSLWFFLRDNFFLSNEFLSTRKWGRSIGLISGGGATATQAESSSIIIFLQKVFSKSSFS